jgi:2-amino-4-hydroxy-6-hydroxymethyldihydropteridine diphosphokinase
MKVAMPTKALPGALRVTTKAQRHPRSAAAVAASPRAVVPVVKVARLPQAAAANKADRPPHSHMASSRQSVTAFVALGANLGNARQAVLDALAALNTLSGTRLVKASSLYRTAPVDSSGPDYINVVAELATQLTAPDLLLALQQIEQAAGRERPYLNAPRTLDLDLLLFGAATMDSPHLTVPHPRMWARAFVLVPLAEVAPGLVSDEAMKSVNGQAVEVVQRNR